MRAVTGTILSTKPCATAKAAHILKRFQADAPSGLLSSHTATYLRTAIEAAAELNLFRRARQQRDGGESESKRRHRPPPVDEEGRWEPKVEEHGRCEPEVVVEEYGLTVPAAAEKGSKRREHKEQGIADLHGDLRSPASEKKRRRKKEKHVKEEDQTGDAIEEQRRKSLDDALQGMASEEGGIDSGKKLEKKKHIKQEEEVWDAKEAEQKVVHAGVGENGFASEEKRRKKRKHTEEVEVKKEVVDDGDLGSDKKRKKKRGRDGDGGNDMKLVEHTKKKQRK